MDATQAPVSASPESAEASSLDALDPLAEDAARRIADVICDIRRALAERDGIATTTQVLQLAFTSVGAPTAKLTISPDYITSVSAELKTPAPVAPSSQSACKRTRRVSDADLERDIVSRKRRRLEAGEDGASQRPPASADDDGEDIMPLITKEDLDDLLVKLRDDIQDDTAETVNHVQRLLRRFKQEWHEQTKHAFDMQQTQPPHRSSISAAPGGSFPSTNADHDDDDAAVSTVDVIRREAALISRQVKWVEDCRRVANEVHVKREDTWRTSSAGFHDQQRQDREQFQARMMHESALHSQTLNQILNEVKAIGLYAQNMKWETPSYLNQAPQAPTPPAFPTQQPTPVFPTQPTRAPPSGSRDASQQRQFTWKAGRGPGSRNP